MSFNLIKNRTRERMFELIDFKMANYLFTGKIDFDSFVVQITFEILKEDLYNRSMVKSLRQWLNEYDLNTEYQSYKRTIKYIRHYKEELKSELDPATIMNKRSDLEIKKMDSMGNRTTGYELNVFHFTQMLNIQNYQLLKVIIDKRICLSKKISNSRFKELYNELDNHYSNMKSEDVTLENMINFYEIEKNYSTEMIYKLSSIISENKLSLDESLSKLGMLFTFNYQLDANHSYGCENRFLAHRHLYIDDFLFPQLNDQGICEESKKFLNILYLKSLLLQNSSIKDSILSNNQIELIDIVKSKYPLMEIIQDKKWDNKKIQIARKLFDGLYKNTENPKIRT